MFEKWFKENNENIYILREDLDILKSNKDLNILNLYLNLNKKNGEFGIEELLKDMILIKENIIKEYEKDRNFEIKIVNENSKNKDNNTEISEEILKENWNNVLKYISIGEPLFYQMVKNSIPFNLNKINNRQSLEEVNEYDIIIAFANNPVLYLKNKNFEMVVKNLLEGIYNSNINITIELNRNDIEILREKKLKEEEQYENDKKEISRNYILQSALNRENREKEKEKEKEQEEDKLQEKANNSNSVSTNIEKNQKQSVVKSNGSSNVSISSNTIEKKTGTDKEKKHIFGRMPYGKEVPVVKVKGIHENLGDIIIVGEIIDKEIREIREDLSLASYAVYDGTSSIMVKKFLKKAEIEDVEKRIKEHMSQNGLFKIYGKPRI